MQHLGTERHVRKGPLTIRQSPCVIEPIKKRHSNPIQSNPGTHQKKKNHNLQSIVLLAGEFANLEPAQNLKENCNPNKKNRTDKILTNQQVISSKAPFANATNTKPAKSQSVKPSIPRTQCQKQITQRLENQLQKSPKPNQRSKALCENLCEQKLNGITETKKKSATYRIHLSASKDKQNLLNNHNRVNSLSQQREQRSSLIEESLQQRPTPQKSQSYPAIDQDTVSKLTTNRQKSCQSFMIRSNFLLISEKIHSTMLQNQKNSKQNNNPCQWSKNYRKDKFSKAQNLQPLSNQVSNAQKTQGLETQKTQGQQQIAQASIKNSSNQNNRALKKVQAFKGGKSLKMRKNKFSKPQNEVIYEQATTQPNKAEVNLQLRFQNTLQENLQFKKVHTMDYQLSSCTEQENLLLHKKIVTECQKNSEKALFYKQNGKCQSGIDALYEMAQKYFPFKPIQHDQFYLPIQSGLIVSKQAISSKRRVSSIRALKNLYRNFQNQDKSEMNESRNGGQTKRKQKQAPCLTHKIKWGNQTKRKYSQDKLSNLIGPVFATTEKEQKVCQQQKDIKLQVQQIKIKQKKKIRFMDEIIDSQSPISSAKNRSIERKSSFEGNEKSQVQKPQQTIGSRSLIMFDDPGISVIVRKNSSMQSSAHVYTTIEHELQPSENECTESGIDENKEVNSKKRRQSIRRQHPRLQSLKELFLELKSHKSIQIDQNN